MQFDSFPGVILIRAGPMVLGTFNSIPYPGYLFVLFGSVLVITRIVVLVLVSWFKSVEKKDNGIFDVEFELCQDQ